MNPEAAEASEGHGPQQERKPFHMVETEDAAEVSGGGGHRRGRARQGATYRYWRIMENRLLLQLLVGC